VASIINKPISTVTTLRDLREVVNQLNILIKNSNENQALTDSQISQINAQITIIYANIAELEQELLDLKSDVEHNLVEDIITYRVNGNAFDIVYDEIGNMVVK